MRRILVLALAASAVFAGGCNTFERRAREKGEVFAALPAETRERLKSKSLRVGDTEDMVFIALGKPDLKTSVTTAAGERTTWIYNRYWQEYQGEAYAMSQRRVVRNPATGETAIYWETVSRPVYAARQQPVLRVEFVGGKVAVIEQAQD